jgi:hypothetical protein
MVGVPHLASAHDRVRRSTYGATKLREPGGTDSASDRLNQPYEREQMTKRRYPVLTQSATPIEPARYRGMPRDVMLATYDANRGLYDGIQETVPTADQSEVEATLLAFLGSQDNQLAAEGPNNGLFTENVIAIWNEGAWKGSHAAFYKAIRARMPPS